MLKQSLLHPPPDMNISETQHQRSLNESDRLCAVLLRHVDWIWLKYIEIDGVPGFACHYFLIMSIAVHIADAISKTVAKLEPL